MVYMFIFINKVKFNFKVVGFLILVNWGFFYFTSYFKVLSFYIDGNGGDGNVV